MFAMRTCVLLLALSAFVLSGCGDSSGPTQETITFRADPVTCAGVTDVEITIDGENHGTFQFTPGSEWVFPTSAGVHTVKAQGEMLGGGFVNIEREVTVPEGGDFTVVLTCTA
jgi:hypothetical protein